MTGGADDRLDVRDGVDTDQDGHADTLLVPGGPDLVLAVDTGRDGYADLIIQVGPDAVAHIVPLPPGPPPEACYADPADVDPDSIPW